MNDLTTELFELRLRIKFPKTSSEAILLRYLSYQKRLKPSHHKNMIIKALAAFWLPMAYKHEKQDDLMLFRLEEAIFCLKKHIKYLEELVKLNEAKFDLNSLDFSLINLDSLNYLINLESINSKNGEAITQEDFKANEPQDDGSYISVIQVQDF
jgi:hypothetical protein